MHRNCQTCSKLLEGSKQKKFCSISCATKAQQNRVKRICTQCATPYTCVASAAKRNRSKFCSVECRRKNVSERLTQWISATCEWCNKEFSIKPSHNRRFCGMSCYRAYQKSPSWSKELSHSGAGYLQSLRKEDFKCRRCSEKSDHIHHADGNNSNNTPDNLIPLCSKCHKLLHTYFLEAQKGLKEFTFSFIKS